MELFFARGQAVDGEQSRGFTDPAHGSNLDQDISLDLFLVNTL